MTTSRYPEITDELLSAYIDGAVTSAERMAVEQHIHLVVQRQIIRHGLAPPKLQTPRDNPLTGKKISQPEKTKISFPATQVAGIPFYTKTGK